MPKGFISSRGAAKGAYESPSVALRAVGEKVQDAIENQDHGVEGKLPDLHIHFTDRLGGRQEVILPSEVYVRTNSEGEESFVGFRSSILRDWWKQNITEYFGDVDVYIDCDVHEVWVGLGGTP